MSSFWSTEPRDPAHRVRSVLLAPASGTVTVDEHVRVRLPARARPPWLADVLIEHGTGARRAAETAVVHPGALVVAVHHGSRCWLRFSPDGAVVELESQSAADTGRPEEVWAALASLAHTWLVAGLPIEEFGLALPYVLQIQASDLPPSICPSRRRADSASSDRDRPTEA